MASKNKKSQLRERKDSPKISDSEEEKSLGGKSTTKDPEEEMDSENDYMEFEDLMEVKFEEEPKKCPNWRFPRLYKRNKKGDIIFWEIGFDGKYLRTRNGKHGADKKGKPYKIREDIPGTIVVPKVKRNLIEQSLLEGRNKYNLRIRNKDFRDKMNDAIYSTEPTLANEYNYLEDNIFDGEDEWGIEVKLDGIRARGIRDGDSVKLVSRNNVEFEFLEIYQELSSSLLKELPEARELDGELYIHGQLFQKTMSALRRTKNRNETQEGTATYYIFDFAPEKEYEDLTYSERHQLLVNAHKRAFKTSWIVEDGVLSHFRLQILGYIPITSNDEALEYLKVFEEMKFEGAMLRRLSQKGYENGRSTGLLKLKSFEDEEAIIIGIEQGKKARSEGKAIFILKNKTDGVEFRAWMKADDAEKRFYFKNKERLIGKEMTYKHQPPKSGDGKPRFPVAICIRDYEGE
jgi:hypothetical protein